MSLHISTINVFKDKLRFVLTQNQYIDFVIFRKSDYFEYILGIKRNSDFNILSKPLFIILIIKFILQNSPRNHKFVLHSDY
jgi:hypothetical protein